LKRRALSNESFQGDRPNETPLPAALDAREPDALVPARLMRVGLIVEGSCLVAALILGAWGFHDPSQPLLALWSVDWVHLAGWTLAGFAGCVAIAVVVLWMPLDSFRAFRQFVLRVLVPLFSPLSIGQVALLATCAGIGEEMLFRWCLQGGLTRVLPVESGWLWALVIASVVFGLCHAVGWLYFVFATLIGLLMGIVMMASGSVVPSIAAHGFYDFVAILVLRWMGRRCE
jgi:membrane protease YdiL (CAAX protease family)